MRTAYNFGPVIPAETVKGKSITQPEQVLPLRKIMYGLRNGTLVLDMSKQQYFDIPEHEIDVQPGRTPESTNAAIADATLADLSAKADAAGEDITASPGFTIEDAADLIDGVEVRIADEAVRKAALRVSDSPRAGAAPQKASDGPKGEDDGAHSAAVTPPSKAANDD